MNTYRLFLSLLVCLIGASLWGQTLYKDALRIIDATRSSDTTYLEIQADTTVPLIVTKHSGDKDLPPVVREVEGPFPAVIALEENVRYDLLGEMTTFRMWQGRDTFPQTGFLTTGDIETAINNYAGYAKISLISLDEESTTAWAKPNFLDLHATLAQYERPGDYSIEGSYERFKDDSYLGPVVQSDVFSVAKAEGEVLNRLIEDIEQAIALRRGQKLPGGLDLLHQDSVISTENLLSILNVQKEYQVPAIKNPEALAGTAQKVKSAQLNAGAADFTSTLIAGLSDFVVARAQDEFNVSFMNRFQARLREAPEMAILFPQSATFLGDIDVTNYKSILVSAREAFQADVKNLGLNFTGLFELDKYKNIQNDPVVYNLLTVYQMMELVYRGLPLDTILPLTFNQLVQRQEEIGKEVNLALADSLLKHDTPALVDLSGKMQIFQDSLEAVWLDINRVEQRFLFDIAGRLGGLGPEESEPLARVFLKMDEELAPIRLELFNTLDTLQIIPNNLRGTLNYDYLFDRARLDDFDRYFDRPPDSLGLIGAGLELTRRQVLGIDGKPNKAELLMAYTLTLKEAQEEYQAMVYEMERDSLAELEQENRQLDERRKNLVELIMQDTAFWRTRGAPLHAIKGLEFIAHSIEEPREFQSFFDEDRQPATLLESLQARRRLLTRAEGLLQARLDDLNQRYPGAGQSVVDAFLNPEDTPAPAAPATPLDRLQGRAFDLIRQSGAIAGQLKQWDGRYCDHLLQARTNAETFGGILELSSYLVDAFRTTGEGGRKWISPEEFNALIGDAYRRKVFLGLVHQNLREANIFRGLSDEGVANLVSSFINTLGEVNTQVDTLKALRANKQRPRLRDYFPLIEATVTMVNDVLETPLVLQPNAAGDLINAPLTQVYPTALQNIPNVSREVLGLFENVSYENYRYAINNAVNLFDLLSRQSLLVCQDTVKNRTKAERKACQARVQTIQNIVKYGNFISDIAMAQQPDDIKQALLNVDVAGKSSQTKREDRANLSLNGYFGGAFAREYPNFDPGATGGPDAEDFLVGSLSVPIGLTFSFKMGENDPGSFSLFVPVIDIGAVTSFRIEQGGGNRYPELNLSNVIAPGIFLYRNMKNSPFYFGLGYQYGPNLRKIDVGGNLEEVNSSRFVLLNFGIDVPFFSLARVRE